MANHKLFSQEKVNFYPTTVKGTMPVPTGYGTRMARMGPVQICIFNMKADLPSNIAWSWVFSLLVSPDALKGDDRYQ